MREHAEAAEQGLEEGLRQRHGIANPVPSRVQKIGRSIIRSNDSTLSHVEAANANASSSNQTAASTSQKTSRKPSPERHAADGDGVELTDHSTSQPSQPNQRAIRFPDENTEREEPVSTS